ncbi:MAG: CatA-like O-acetyltransferase [Candidatus Heteroscillospira sp.]|jgi:chloramphenicol O-acetyltransferase type A
MKKINLDLWERRELFEFFSPMSDPFYSITFTLDVTKLYEYTHRRQISFYYALVYLSTKALNRVEELRYTIRGGDVWLLDERIPSFTDLHPGSETFHIVTLPCRGTMDEFCRAARDKSRAQTRMLNQSEETDDLMFITCLPWFDATAVKNERDMDPDDAIPRLAWGKYVQNGDKKELHYSVELNHRFADGFHVGRFYQELSALISEL